MDRETLLTELRAIGFEIKHAQRRLDGMVTAAQLTITEAFEAGLSADEISAAYGFEVS